MRMLKIFAFLAVALAFAASPALATCVGNPAQFTSAVAGEPFSFVWTDGWDVGYFDGYPPFSGTMTNPITADFFGVYWALGQGDVTLGPGVDAGTQSMPPAVFVTYQPEPDFAVTFAGPISGSWGAQGVDDCIGIDTCECVLLTDQRDGIGYFAMLSALTSDTKVANLTQAGTDGGGNAGPIILREVPAPVITRVDLDQDTNVATFNVSVGSAAAGVYAKDGCDCGPVGYVLYEAAVDTGGPPPGDRDGAGWTAVTGVLAMGTAAVYDSTVCTAFDVEVYLATGLVFDSDFSSGGYTVHLSGNSNALRCGTNIAEPTDLQPKIRRQLRDTPRPDRKR